MMSGIFERISGIFILILFPHWTLANGAIASQCVASQEYLTELKRYGTSLHIDKDFSCLTDLPSLGQKLSLFQIIDTRSQASSFGKISKDAWIMPVSELKHKSFLIRKPLLLIGDGFSRASAANDCAILKKSGFSRVKILVGGVDVWKSVKATTHQNHEIIDAVSAQQLILEYFNSRVSIIAMSTTVASKLTEMGITKFYTLENSDQQIGDIVLTKSNNGFDPVVIVNENDNYPPKISTKFHNLYQLAGGIGALRQQLNGNLWINHNRTDVPRSYVCGKQ